MSSLRVNGGAVFRPAVVSSYTVPATITSNTDLSVQANIPIPSFVAPRTVTTTSTKTTYFDTPGTSSAQVRALSTRAQFEALRSAAANTAKAFSLDVTRAADLASKLQQQTFQDDIPTNPIVVDVVVIPK